MDDDTKTKIWETFKDKLIDEGINSPAQIILQEKLPDESELVKSGTILKKTGQLGKLVIWVVKKAVWVGGAIVIYAALPGALEQIRTRHPRTFEVVDNIGKAVKSYHRDNRDSKDWESAAKTEYRGQYVVFNENWVNDKTQFAEDIQALDDINRLPQISKSDIIQNLSEMCAKNAGSLNADYVSTGGTSGIPLHFYINAKRSSIEFAYLTTSWERAGYRLGSPMAVIRGRTVGKNRNGFYYEYDPILRHHYYSNFHMSDENMARYLEHISHCRSRFSFYR